MDVKDLDENPYILLYNHVVAMIDAESVFDTTIYVKVCFFGGF